MQFFCTAAVRDYSQKLTKLEQDVKACISCVGLIYFSACAQAPEVQ